MKISSEQQDELAGQFSPLSALRAKTTDVHQRLHFHPVTKSLVDANLSESHYIFALWVFERFNAVVEKDLDIIAAPYKSRANTSLLCADLAALSATTNNLPRCPSLNTVKNLNDSLGVMYVIEGSRLGGQLIAKNIKKTLGFDARTGASFFSGDGNQTAQNWREFLMCLNRYCSDIPRTARAARATFLHLEDWMTDMWRLQSPQNASKRLNNCK